MTWVHFLPLIVLAAIVILFVVLVHLLGRKVRDYPPEEILQQEAETLGRQIGAANVRICPPVEISREDLLRQLDSRPPREGTVFLVVMKGDIPPLERYERFEEPVARAFGSEGAVEGGGTFSRTVEGRSVIESVDFSVRVRDPVQGLTMLRNVLKSCGAPAETTITDPDGNRHTL